MNGTIPNELDTEQGKGNNETQIVLKLTTF